MQDTGHGLSHCPICGTIQCSVVLWGILDTVQIIVPSEEPYNVLWIHAGYWTSFIGLAHLGNHPMFCGSMQDTGHDSLDCPIWKTIQCSVVPCGILDMIHWIVPSGNHPMSCGSMWNIEHGSLGCSIWGNHPMFCESMQILDIIHWIVPSGGTI